MNHRVIYIQGILLVSLAVAAHGQVKYNVTDLGTMFEGGFSVASGINRSGQVTGFSCSAGGSQQQCASFRTAPNSPINQATDNLGTLSNPFTNVLSSAINDDGRVAGYAYSPYGAASHAFRTAPNSPIDPTADDLGISGRDATLALGINNVGQIVGYSCVIAAQAPCFAFRTAGNTQINPTTDDLGTLGGTLTRASGINELGQVVGGSYLNGNVFHAFRTAPNMPINASTDNLGTLGGQYSEAFGINGSGQVIGNSSPLSSDFVHAFRTGPNKPINPVTDDLGTLGGQISEAAAINAGGQVVGGSTAPLEGHAFLYSSGVMFDLNDLIPAGSGWVLEQASAINDSGQIVGRGLVNGALHGFRLDPVPTVIVSIDIKPGQDPATINPTSNGNIAVAILSGSGFNAAVDVDRASLTFGRTGNEQKSQVVRHFGCQS